MSDKPIGFISILDEYEQILINGVPVQLAPAYTLDENGLPDKIIEISLVPIISKIGT